MARVRAGSDGHPYIDQAITNGASLIIAQKSPESLNLTISDDVVYWQVEDTAVVYAWLSAAWYDFPSQHLTIIGITGTDGKTTTATIIAHILAEAGYKYGLLSTIKAIIGPIEEPLELHVTTPEAPVIQRYLRRMVDAGLSHCILESTSHALAQHRVTSVDFDVAVVTNITHEHLDYHGSYKAYLTDKARLFQLAQHTAVLNHDDQSYAHLTAISIPPQYTYAIHHHADVTATDIIYEATQTTFTLNLPANQSVPIRSNLVGDFNVYNMLAAATAVYRLGITPQQIKKGIESVGIISGRMEQINEGQAFLTLVDFAHTPHALEKAIEAARRMTDGRIITVFGSAGKRDVEKRKLMAEISARDADLTVLTAEDPRTESLDNILAMMAVGCQRQNGRENQTFWRIPDRGQAIYYALTLAHPTDLVLICGKGHEQSMCFGTIEHAWDDRNATRVALRAFLNGDPMPDLGLPTFNNHHTHSAIGGSYA